MQTWGLNGVSSKQKQLNTPAGCPVPFLYTSFGPWGLNWHYLLFSEGFYFLEFFQWRAGHLLMEVQG